MSGFDADAAYVSTTCFGSRDFASILDECERHEIPALELSAVDNYDPSRFGSTRHPNRFLVHNYFPPPATAFVLNLSSQHPSTLDRSRRLCCEAIELSERLGGSVYAAHGGFTADLDPSVLGNPQAQAQLPGETFATYEDAYRTLVESAVALTHHADSRGVRFLIENHVLPRTAGDTGRRLLPMVAADELVRLARDVDDEGFGVLLDVGHLNVSAATLGFDRHRFIDSVAPWIGALHLSDNTGLADTHSAFADDAWFLPRLRDFPGLPVTIELGPTTSDVIKTVCDVVARWR